MYEVLRWAYFNEKYLFENLDDDPRIGLIGSFKFDVQDVLQQALDFVNKDSDEEYRLFNLLNGYRRVDPAKGAEYILDLELEKVDEISTVIDRKLLYLVRPFHNLQLLSRKFGKTNQNVNFIIPLSKVTDRLKDFMANYEKICLKTKEYTSLLAVLFPGTTDDGRRQVEQVKGLFYKYQKQYPEAVISYIETQGEFSRAAGLDIGAKQFSAESLLFFCDVDVDFDAAFLDRCRHNSVLGEQAYYPIVFSQYNPELVYQGSAKIPKETSKDIHKHNGFWIHYGYGMVCLHNQDYRAVGGFDLSIRGWGGEDTDLYERHIKLTKNFNSQLSCSVPAMKLDAALGIGKVFALAYH
uniref:Hexosyltransferase n=1 Tax=Saccoglossus kowalevskii TaxID=10224 RepID=A0ABM0M244_SACKO|nr:PREDICTED: chondroitin sulfate synthase 1-like [Saccoglossus kowalevskii]